VLLGASMAESCGDPLSRERRNVARSARVVGGEEPGSGSRLVDGPPGVAVCAVAFESDEIGVVGDLVEAGEDVALDLIGGVSGGASRALPSGAARAGGGAEYVTSPPTRQIVRFVEASALASGAPGRAQRRGAACSPAGLPTRCKRSVKPQPGVRRRRHSQHGSRAFRGTSSIAMAGRRDAGTTCGSSRTARGESDRNRVLVPTDTRFVCRLDGL
jgi:hypothetical protein